MTARTDVVMEQVAFSEREGAATMSRADLKKGLAMLAPAFRRKHALPILEHVHVWTTEDGMLHLAGTDLEIGITTLVDTIELTGAIDTTFSYKTAAKLVSGGGTTTVVTNRGLAGADLGVIDPDDFPTLPTADGGTTAYIPGDVLANALKLVVRSCAKDDSRPVLGCVRMWSDGAQVRFVSADGFRLSLAERELDTIGVFDVLVPRRSVEAIIKLAPVSMVPLIVSENGATLHLILGSTLLMTRLVEGTFPDYKRIIPTDFAYQAFLNAEDVVEAMARLKPIVSSNNGVTRWEAKDEALTVSGRNGEEGTATARLAIPLTATLRPIVTETTIAFNRDYVEDIAAVVPKGEGLRLKWNGATQAGVFTVDGLVTNVLMPMVIGAN